MLLAIVLLIVPALLISLIGTKIMLVLGRRAGALDTAPIEGQVKEAPRPIPNTGGVAIAAAVWVPTLLALLGAHLHFAEEMIGDVGPMRETWDMLLERLSLGWAVFAAVVVVHLIGVYDDRRPLGAMPKLVAMLMIAAVFPVFFETRLLTMLDAYPGGVALSTLLSIAWIVVVMNTMNFIDNTDGFSAGVAVIAATLFLVAALINNQWFVAAMLALLVGACLGFLCYNFPPARIFMGDGGSLVIGFVLAIATIRATYLPEPDSDVSGGWYGVLMPVAVLAVPLYDFFSVTLIRIRQGKSPFKGDLQHFSHRLRNRGLSARSTVLVAYALTAASGIAGILLTRATPWQAALLGVQIVAVIGALALFEYKSPALEPNER